MFLKRGMRSAKAFISPGRSLAPVQWIWCLSRDGSRTCDIGNARYLASRIPGARLCEIDSGDHLCHLTHLEHVGDLTDIPAIPMNSPHLRRPTHASRPIETLLSLRNTATQLEDARPCLHVYIGKIYWCSMPQVRCNRSLVTLTISSAVP